MKSNNDINKKIEFLEKRYGINESFDLVGRRLQVSGIEAYMMLIDGFAKDHIMLHVVQRLQGLKISGSKIKDITAFVKINIAYMEVEISDDFNFIESMFLSGAIILFFDKEDKAIIIDAREYPVRSVMEPDLEKVTRGPRDGFVETIIFNTALIRRRVKDDKLRFKIKTVGTRTKTNVSLAYIDDLVDKNLLKEIENKIDNLKLETLVMAEKSLAEAIIKSNWFNPLPKTRFTERPDVAASHLFEGHILIIVDGTPSVMIIPTTIFHFTQYAEDYYQVPIVGTYIRHIRFLALFLSLFLIPVWFLLSLYPDILPRWVQLISPGKSTHLPVIAQILILEFSVDLLKVSSIHTPSSLNSSLGIIGGLILGNFAISAGLFTEEAVIVTAITGIASFATSSIEFGFGIRIFRLFLLVTTAIFKLPGFIISTIIIIIVIFTTKNGTNTKYTYPLYPFNFAHLKHILFRVPIPKTKK